MVIYYIIEFLKSLQIKDYLFLLFLCTPLLTVYIFHENIDIIKEKTFEYKISSNIKDINKIYNKTNDYYFKEDPLSSCLLFSKHLESYTPYSPNQNGSYRCQQKFHWEDSNVVIVYNAYGENDKIKKATFSFSVELNFILSKDIIIEILKNNFRIKDTEKLFNNIDEKTINVQGYKISIKDEEKIKVFIIE